MDNQDKLNKVDLNLAALHGEELALKNFALRFNVSWFFFAAVVGLWSWAANFIRPQEVSYAFTLCVAFFIAGIFLEIRRRKRLSEIAREIDEMKIDFV